MARLLRKHRQELGFSRETAAVSLAVSARTVTNWEAGLAPLPANYPEIIEFLGVEPWPAPKTLSEKLRAARLRRGWTIGKAADALGVNTSTFRWWEAGRSPHRRSDREALSSFIGGPRRCPPAQTPIQPAEQPEPLGLLLRKRRKALGQSLETAAGVIGANPWTLLSWEHERRTPTDRFYPAIIRYLERRPWPSPESLGDRIRVARLSRGLTKEQAAAIMQVSPDSVSDWEGGRLPRHRLSLARIDAFLNGGVRPRRSAAHQRVRRN
jgi:transcriptional regulator with XRE-family HTH domain